MTDTSDEPVAVILAGGQGSRLWPISSDRAPKQFQPVVRDRPLLTGTIERSGQIPLRLVSRPLTTTTR